MKRLSERPARRRRAAITFAITAGMVLALQATPAGAHESRVVGDVVMVVGWGNEPTYAGYQHPVEVFLSEPGKNEEEEGPPISDADLQVEVFFAAEAAGTSSGLLPMEEAFGEPGHFETPFIPTRPGTYTFRLTGTVAGQTIDEVFTSGPDTFSDAELAADISFPAKDPTVGELAQAVERLNARADEGGGPELWIALAAGVLALIALAAALRRRSAA